MLTGRWPAATGSFTPPQSWPAAGGELELLKAQAERLEETLAQLRERISKLEGE
jgi:hypothetical protein